METLCTPKSIFLVTNCIPSSNSSHSSKTLFTYPKKFSPLFQSKSYKTLKPQISPKFKNPLPIPKFPSFINPHLCFLSLGLSFPLPTFASETTLPLDQVSSRINLEQIVVSIDEFNNKYPFFVAGVAFIWLFVIPVTQVYLSNYKYVTTIDAFKKLKDDPNAQLLDIRDRRSIKALPSPSLRFFNKKVLQAEFKEGDEDGFVKKVSENFGDPANTVVCILDNFDGNSYKVAGLLVNNGFKAAYAISDGVRGKDGWLNIQEADLLPPTVHMYPPEKVKKSKKLEKLEKNGAVNSQPQDSDDQSSSPVATSKHMDNGHVNVSIEPTAVSKNGSRSSSPYSMYPEMKPPSSPTPSKPRN